MKRIDSLRQYPESCDFLDIMRWLERSHPEKPRIGDSSARDEEIAILGQPPYVEFPASNIETFSVDALGRYRVISKFLGLLGPQGALPLHTSYEARHWADMRDESFARFLDIFNHRFQQLFFRAWSNARPAGQFDRPSEDRFADYIGTTIGVGTSSFRNRDSLHDFAKIAVAGLLSPAIKSASRLRAMLQYLFRAEVAVEQFVGMWMPLEKQDQTSLSGLNAALGKDTILGSSVFSLQDKFRIRIRARSLEEYESFLPNGMHCDRLADSVSFYLGNVLAFEVALGLPETETRPLRLGQFGRLGWTSWLKARDRTAVAVLRWDCRFHPVERRSDSQGGGQ